MKKVLCLLLIALMSVSLCSCESNSNNPYRLYKKITNDNNGDLSQIEEYSYYPDGFVATDTLTIYHSPELISEGQKYGIEFHTINLFSEYEYNDNKDYAKVYCSGNDINGDIFSNYSDYYEYYFDEKGNIIATDDGEWLTVIEYDENNLQISSAIYIDYYGSTLYDKIGTGNKSVSHHYVYDGNTRETYTNGSYRGKEVYEKDDNGNIVESYSYDSYGELESTSKYYYINIEEMPNTYATNINNSKNMGIVNNDKNAEKTNDDKNYNKTNSTIDDSKQEYISKTYEGVLYFNAPRNACYLQLAETTVFTDVIYNNGQSVSTNKLWFFDDSLKEYVGEVVAIESCLQLYSGEVCFTDDYKLLYHQKTGLADKFSKAYDVVEKVLMKNPAITSVRFMVDEGWETALNDSYSDLGFNPVELSINYNWPSQYGYTFYITPYDDYILIMYDDTEWVMDTPYWKYDYNGEMLYGIEGPFEEYIMNMRFMETYSFENKDTSTEKKELSQEEKDQIMLDESGVLPEYRFANYTPEVVVSGYLRNGTQFVLDNKMALKGYWSADQWDIIEELYIPVKYGLETDKYYTLKGTLYFDEFNLIEIIQ